MNRFRQLILSIGDRYPAVRETYLRVCKKKYWREYEAFPRAFYAGLIHDGDTVFDVGANRGHYVRYFIAAGAGRVVAIEPIPRLAEHIRKTNNGRVHVIEAAVSGQPGIARLHIARREDVSSLSPEWLDTISWHDRSWEESIAVRTVTLDDLIAEFGTPAFIKIDVEGAEILALSGLSYPVPLLSFEFHPATVDAAVACLLRPCFSLQSRCNYTIGMLRESNGGFQLDRWVPIPAMIEIARNELSGARFFGDIFVRT